jgi:hypothetical protein
MLPFTIRSISDDANIHLVCLLMHQDDQHMHQIIILFA